jgi:hypothetical protein
LAWPNGFSIFTPVAMVDLNFSQHNAVPLFDTAAHRTGLPFSFRVREAFTTGRKKKLFKFAV